MEYHITPFSAGAAWFSRPYLGTYQTRYFDRSINDIEYVCTPFFCCCLSAPLPLPTCRYGSDSGSDSDDDGPDDGREGIAAFDTDIIAGDAQAGCKEARLSTLQASRLLVLMSHARTCPGRHANPQHADVCRSTKFLMLHMRDCNG